MILVRDATVADARGIAELRIAGWRAAYAGLVPQAMLDAMDADRETARRTERWTEFHGPGVHDLVAIDGAGDGGGVGESVVGWAVGGPARDDDAPAAGELYALYAAPDRIGEGIGHALIAEIERRLVADGHRSAMLWVLEGNARASAFYEAHGWHADGGAKLDGELRERRHVRALPTV